MSNSQSEAAVQEALQVLAIMKERAGHEKGKQEPVDVVKKGRQIILPEGMSEDECIKWMQRKKAENETVIAVSEEVQAYPLEGAYALQKAIAEKYGWTNLIPTPGFFGDTPPAMIGVEVAPSKTVQVPWGRFSIPNVDGWIAPGFLMKDDRFVFNITGQIRKKNQEEIRELADLTRKIVLRESLYKGKALRVSFPENPEEFNPGYQPKFLDVSQVGPMDLIFSETVQAQIQTNLFTPIEKTSQCRKFGIPLKRGVLLEGPFGTGKTLTAFAAAQKCEANGWTFLLLESVKDLAQAIDFARQYQPCMIFAEDVDRVTEGNRDMSMDDILNTIDGIESKGTEIFVVLTTNNVDKINQAMLRPGRLDAVVSVTAPDAAAAARLVGHYGRGLIASGEDLATVGRKLAGQIPAVIREVVERAKLAALAHGDDLALRAHDLSIAADGMLAHLALLKPRPVDNRTALEKFGAVVGSHLADGLTKANHHQPSVLAGAPVLQEASPRVLNGATS